MEGSAGPIVDQDGTVKGQEFSADVMGSVDWFGMGVIGSPSGTTGTRVRAIGVTETPADDPGAESMHRSMNMPPFAADLIGPMARQILSPDSSGTILAGYSRAVYLRSAAGELFWLAPGDVPCTGGAFACRPLFRGRHETRPIG